MNSSYIKKYTDKLSENLLNPKSPEELFKFKIYQTKILII